MLNKKKKSFAEEYLKTGDAITSAIKSGYKSRSYANTLLKDPEINEYMLKYIDNSKIATAQEVLQFLTAIMRGEEWEISVTVKKDTGEKLLTGEPPSLTQRQKAAELLAKRYRLFSEDISDDKGNEAFSVNIKVI